MPQCPLPGMYICKNNDNLTTATSIKSPATTKMINMIHIKIVTAKNQVKAHNKINANKYREK